MTRIEPRRFPILPAAFALVAVLLLLGCSNLLGRDPPRSLPENGVKISSTAGGFPGSLQDGDLFGFSVAAVKDLDGDGVPELAVGVPRDDSGAGADCGAVWVLFLNQDGAVKDAQKITIGMGGFMGGFAGSLDAGDYFGQSVGCLDDLDGDGVAELAVGAPYDDDGSDNSGAVWVLQLNADGTAKGAHKISSSEGGLTPALNTRDWFGVSLAGIGDLDGDGVPDLAVGSMRDDGGGENAGAVWVLRLHADGTVKGAHKIAAGEGALQNDPDTFDYFGASITGLGDLDDDGVRDIAVGAIQDRDGGPSCGAVWAMFLHPDGTLKDFQKISAAAGGFEGQLDSYDMLGSSLASLGDFNHDTKTELAMGACKDDDGGRNRGCVRIRSLTPDGTVE